MSKVGESIIQGAIEALEFAQGKGNGPEVHVEAVSLSDSSELDFKIIEEPED